MPSVSLLSEFNLRIDAAFMKIIAKKRRDGSASCVRFIKCDGTSQLKREWLLNNETSVLRTNLGVLVQTISKVVALRPKLYRKDGLTIEEEDLEEAKELTIELHGLVQKHTAIPVGLGQTN